MWQITGGKYFTSGEQILLPFSVQVNHTLADGLHVGRYVEKLQAYLDAFSFRDSDN